MRRVLFVDHVTRIVGGAEINLLELLGSDPGPPPWAAACACAREGKLDLILAQRQIPRHDYGLEGSLNTLRVVGKTPSLFKAARGMLALRKAGRRLDEILAGKRFDVVVSCTNKDHFAAAGAARRAGIPSVWWVNDILSKEFFPAPARALFHWNARRASRLIAVSEHARQVLLQGGRPAAQVTTIRNGIPLAGYARKARGALRGPLGLPDDAVLVGLVGRYTRWKGQLFFARLAEQWARTHPRGHFVMIGQAFNEDAGFERELRDFVMAKGLCERVRFIPFQQDTAAVLSDLDVMVHASIRPEPFGRVIIEAMAVGVPVIAARAGGVPEIIEHGRSGLLAEPGNEREYLTMLGRLMDSPALRAEFGQAGRILVERNFSLGRVRDQFEQVFAELESRRQD